MAARAKAMLPPLLGNVGMVTATDDAAFFAELDANRYDAVVFAPGACRAAAAGRPIPGGDATTRTWSLAAYEAAVRDHQGARVPIVAAAEERRLVPLLREALGLPAS